MKKVLILLLCSLLLTGCVFTSTLPKDQTIQTPTTPPTEPATDAPTDPAPLTVTIYYGDENAIGFETVEAVIDTLDPDALMNQLIAAGAVAEGTAVRSAELEGTCLHLDLNAAFGDQVCAMGTSGEKMIVGSVVNTFLSAYGAETLTFTVEGGVLESGHVVYDFELGFFE